MEGDGIGAELGPSHDLGPARLPLRAQLSPVHGFLRVRLSSLFVFRICLLTERVHNPPNQCSQARSPTSMCRGQCRACPEVPIPRLGRSGERDPLCIENTCPSPIFFCIFVLFLGDFAVSMAPTPKSCPASPSTGRRLRGDDSQELLPWWV